MKRDRKDRKDRLEGIELIPRLRNKFQISTE